MARGESFASKKNRALQKLALKGTSKIFIEKKSRGSDFQAQFERPRSLNRRQSGFCKLDRLERDQRLKN